ncbi:ParB N-terminal domain-containing protein [uncultured Tateyamaria sp.]|uniref:ParB/RepB/Spo0J family partition protein n=1 Tax=uncultured Tateyamaria sp. TaxID=455651 RepID=UPI002622FAAD|nr:ParB N-terminal domain-containing protein [uncultured Tateyamaria sp.]
MTEEQFVSIELIDIGVRLRDVNEHRAEEYALSIEENGLHQAIVVRPTEVGRFDLVAGAHRLRAHELLGRDAIRAAVRDLDDDEADLVEVEENLLRRELTAAERAISMGIWDEAFRAKNPEYAHGGDRKSSDQDSKRQTLPHVSYREIMERKTGRSGRSNADDIALFKTLGVDALRSLSRSSIADNMVQLKAIAKLDDPMQIERCADDIAEGRYGSVKDWRIAIGDLDEPAKPLGAKAAWMEKQIAHWGEGKKAWRDEFLARIASDQ